MRALIVIAVLAADPNVTGNVIIVESFIEGDVIDVADGDTITVLDAQDEKHTVRLLGIDAPELGGKGRPSQRYGLRARHFLQSLVDGKHVYVRWKGQDGDGLVLGRVYASFGINESVNGEMVRAGLAWSREPHPNSTLALLERAARRIKLGLWADENPTPPWEWRKEAHEAKNAR